MSDRVNLFPVQDTSTPLVQRSGGHQAAVRSGGAGSARFDALLDEVLHPSDRSTPSLPAGVAPFRDRLAGFGSANPSDPQSLTKARVAALAQYLEPNAANLRRLATELGPLAGAISPNGLALQIAGTPGAIGVQDSARGPVWQWMAHDLALPEGSGLGS